MIEACAAARHIEAAARHYSLRISLSLAIGTLPNVRTRLHLNDSENKRSREKEGIEESAILSVTYLTP